MDFAKLYITVFLSAGGSFKHSNSIEHNTFWQHPQPPNVTSRIIKFLGAYTQLVYLSWSPHIKFVCSKSRKVLGVIFRHFYRFSSPKSLLCLYKSLVIPHLSYCSSVWSPPPSSGDARSLENVQFFALKLCSKNWSSSYSS